MIAIISIWTHYYINGRPKNDALYALIRIMFINPETTESDNTREYLLKNIVSMNSMATLSHNIPNDT